MRKRPEAKGMTFAIAVAALIAASCTLAERSEFATLNLSIRQEKTFATKAGGVAMPDTNNFVLQITNSAGEYVYYGRYDARPEIIAVPAGAYSLNIVSEEFDAPDWESPVYGDAVNVVAASGENVNVNFLCKMVNAGLRVKMTERYSLKYPARSPYLRSTAVWITHRPRTVSVILTQAMQPSAQLHPTAPVSSCSANNSRPARCLP